MEYNPFSLLGKRILITGASSGIGREVAIVLSKLGATTILFGRDRERLQITKNMLQNATEHLIYSVDLLDSEKVMFVIHDMKERGFNIDGVINCAGISSTIVLRSITEEKLQNHFNINVNSGVLLIKNLLLKKYSLLNEGGSIVFMSSVMGLVGEVGKTTYAMTKGALIAGVKSLAIELALKKIRVNTISPGVVKTPMSSASFYSKNEESLKKIELLHPLGIGNVEDIANACVYLISDASKWVTGSNLIVDGGYSAR
ncbi:MAG: SDR family oxidoreductase [Lutibacter sp.]|uniref:SDR family NAD(P)-dependent oxidoreductase n=1 Tax=Lutibacter sp. TaxID=1925666 RepID=UPI001A03E6A8|nr:SDR family oxidoreductase [Lutibacter sp.]NOR28401.1 SDR family oxidoreductase [Lutibacter sp.]